MKRRKRGFGCFGCASIILIPLLILVLYIGFNVYKGTTIDINKVQQIETKQNYVATKDMQKYVKNAFVAVEDKRFYQHDGVDWFGTMRALFVSLKNGEMSQGGSSITQQLVKNYYFSQEKSLSRKIQEIVVAKRLENNYSKDQILSYYLNTIYFGDNNYTIEDAANYYFKASSHTQNQYYKQLTVQEAAMLASTINAPSTYDVENYKQDSALISRTKSTLKKMLDQGYINQSDYNNALNGL